MPSIFTELTISVYVSFVICPLGMLLIDSDKFDATLKRYSSFKPRIAFSALYSALTTFAKIQSIDDRITTSIILKVIE